MSCTSFIQTMIAELDTELYDELRDTIIDEYIPLSLAKKEDMTPPVLSEKLCDYFEKVKLKTGKSFEDLVEKYTNDLDSIVGRKIAREPKSAKNKPLPQIPRARRYYDKACSLRKRNKAEKRGLVDYTRLMLCLYMSIIDNAYKTIGDFDYSLKSLNLMKIIESLRGETTYGKKPRFDTRSYYNSDRSTFILLIMLFYYMKSNEMVGEY